MSVRRRSKSRIRATGVCMGRHSPRVPWPHRASRETSSRQLSSCAGSRSITPRSRPPPFAHSDRAIVDRAQHRTADTSCHSAQITASSRCIAGCVFATWLRPLRSSHTVGGLRGCAYIVVAATYEYALRGACLATDFVSSASPHSLSSNVGSARRARPLEMSWPQSVINFVSRVGPRRHQRHATGPRCPRLRIRDAHDTHIAFGAAR